MTQQLEPEGDCRMCTTPNVHRGVGLPWPCGPLLTVHKGLCMYCKLLNEHLTGEGANRKSEWVLLSEGTLEAFKALKKACMTTPVLAFANYSKPFLLETDAVQGWIRSGAVSKADGWVVLSCSLQQQSPYASQEKLPFH